MQPCRRLESHVTIFGEQMKLISHDNIRSFIGACIDPGNISYAMQLCQRGTLEVNLYMYILYSFYLFANCSATSETN